MLAAGLLEHAELYPEASSAKPGKTATAHPGMRIAHPHVHATDSGSQDRFRAGRRATRKRAGLQRDGKVGTPHPRGAVATNGLLERHDLGVRPAGGTRVAAAEDAFAAEHDRTHGRVRKAAARRPSGLGERPAHGALGIH
jgi:hypothetical protein